jgi:DNA-binding NtrC family response regulator
LRENICVKNVLLIDDEEEAVVKPLVAAFASVGIGVDTATTWEDAIDRFLIGGHTIVFADWNLPGSKNGLALLARLKRLRPGSRLVLFSGFLDADQRVSIEALPFVDRAYPKGVDLVQSLVAEAQEATMRGERPTDWVSLAIAYRASADTDLQAVEDLELRLRGGGIQ